MRPTERCGMLPTSPRLTASRANSFWLQWVIGRPLTEGGSQAGATIAQTCSAAKTAGAPERGASARRSATLSSSLPASQRRRQRRTLGPEHACGLAHAFPALGQQDAEQRRCSGPQGKLLGRAVGAAQPLQRGFLLGAQGDAQGGV
jgi:hypothetical protein